MSHCAIEDAEGRAPRLRLRQAWNGEEGGERGEGRGLKGGPERPGVPEFLALSPASASSSSSSSGAALNPSGGTGLQSGGWTPPSATAHTSPSVSSSSAPSSAVASVVVVVAVVVVGACGYGK